MDDDFQSFPCYYLMLDYKSCPLYRDSVLGLCEWVPYRHRQFHDECAAEPLILIRILAYILICVPVFDEEWNETPWRVHVAAKTRAYSKTLALGSDFSSWSIEHCTSEAVEF